jgi:hypothetical protein
MILISILFLAFYPLFFSENINTMLSSLESEDYRRLSPEEKEFFIDPKSIR